MARHWGLAPHQKITPGFADKLCFTATATGSYEEAAQVAGRWTQRMVSPSTVYQLAQRLGALAEQQTQQRMATVPAEELPQRAASQLAVLMVDGWMVRQRGPGWGRKKTEQNRVEWHELKTGVFYLQEQAARTDGDRGLLADKVVVSWQGEPAELGQRLHWEALRGGLGRARNLLFWGTALPGFGICNKTVGPRQSGCWIFIMPANIAGVSGAPCAAKRIPNCHGGWIDVCIGCGMEGKRKFCAK